MKLSDFYTKTNHETPVRLDLELNGKKTDEFIMVYGSEARKLSKPKIAYGIAISKLNEKLKATDDTSERVELNLTSSAELDAQLAAEMVESWSFGDYTVEQGVELFLENESIRKAVIAKSYDHSSGIEKK